MLLHPFKLPSYNHTTTRPGTGLRLLSVLGRGKDEDPKSLCNGKETSGILELISTLVFTNANTNNIIPYAWHTAGLSKYLLNEQIST